MCASQFSTILFLFTIHGVSADGAYGTSCSAAPLKGFAALKDGALVDGAGEPFVFASMNLPNIHRIELPEGGVRKPTLAEVADGLCSVQQMKGRVARTYVLSHGDGDLYHIDGGTVNEGWFAVLDQVIEVAEQLGVYVIIPFVNTFWCAPRRAIRRAILSPRNSSAAHFSDGLSATASAGTSTGARRRTTRSGRAKTLPSRSTSSTTRRNRRSSAASSPPCWSASTRAPAGSTRTSRRSSRGRRATSSSTCGTAPRNSAQFSAQFCAIISRLIRPRRYGAESGVPPPAEWTEGVAAHLRAHGAQQLIMDGAQFTSASLPLAGIDLVGRTCAAAPPPRRLTRAHAHAHLAALLRPPQVLQPASVGARERPSARRDVERAGGRQS